MIKFQVVKNEKLKVLTYVRTHPEELLGLGISFSCFFAVNSEEWSLGPYETKLENVWNVILKILTHVRTHP